MPSLHKRDLSRKPRDVWELAREMEEHGGPPSAISKAELKQLNKEMMIKIYFPQNALGG